LVDDYLSEKEQWEWLKTQLKVNGPWIVAGVAAGALVLAGWRWWQGHADELASQASAQSRQIAEAFGRRDRARALALIDALQREQPKSPYLDQANLFAARAFVEAGELDQAAAKLKTVMETTPDHALALVARERLARVQIAQDQPDAALATLAAVDPGRFAPRYHEVRADAFRAKYDFSSALKEYRAARDADATGLVDQERLDLKIGDLVADERAPRAPAGAK
jgi:predicted negative regulator of RcsB-dependent stress response